MRVLFVDPERDLLDGLENSVRPHRRKWDMVFVYGAAEAIEELRRCPVDVMVTDSSMLGTSGEALLQHAKRTAPATARIILSREDDHTVARRVDRYAHRYLAKPCHVDAVCDAVESTSRLQALLHSDDLRETVGGIERLPSPPDILTETSRLIDDECATIGDIVDVVERDAGLATKVVQIANSAFFGPPRQVVSLDDAVRFIGVEHLYAVVLNSCLWDGLLVLPTVRDGIGTNALAYRQALAVRQALASKLARSFMSGRDRSQENHAFLAGLLHDVGILVLDAQLPDVSEDIRRDAAALGKPLRTIEPVHLGGATHAEVGAYMLSLWDVPTPVVQAVAHHHDPRRAGESDLVAVVHLAQALAGDGASLDREYIENTWLADEISPPSAEAERLVEETVRALAPAV